MADLFDGFISGPPPDNFRRMPDAPYVRGSDTSKAAAEQIEPAAATLRAAVLAYLRGRGDVGATDDEMQSALGLHAHTQCPRRIELERAGLVVKTTARRQTRSGRAAIVWVARAKDEVKR